MEFCFSIQTKRLAGELAGLSQGKAGQVDGHVPCSKMGWNFSKLISLSSHEGEARACAQSVDLLMQPQSVSTFVDA